MGRPAIKACDVGWEHGMCHAQTESKENDNWYVYPYGPIDWRSNTILKNPWSHPWLDHGTLNPKRKDSTVAHLHLFGAAERKITVLISTHNSHHATGNISHDSLPPFDMYRTQSEGSEGKTCPASCVNKVTPCSHKFPRRQQGSQTLQQKTTTKVHECTHISFHDYCLLSYCVRLYQYGTVQYILWYS